jgi:hypothetical protein
MRKLVMAVVALMVMAVIAAPSADAQDYGDKAKSHWMKGTMTPPDQETVDVAYEMSWGDDGAKGWIVADGEDGEKVKIEMKDISMDGDYFKYSFSPPDNADLVVSCSLKKQSDGGFAGKCNDNEENGRSGHMTMAPMGGMNPCGANPCAAKMNPCGANPCAAKMKEMNPCGANPCAAMQNPCSG